MLCIPAGWFVPCGRPVFPFSEICTQLGYSQLIFCSDFWPGTTYYFHREVNKHRLHGTAKAVNRSESVDGVQNEDFGDWSCRNGHRVCTQPAGVAGRHGEKQAESGFAIRASTKASAAVAFDSEGCKGCTHPQQAPASAADSPNNVLQNCSLLPQWCSPHV